MKVSKEIYEQIRDEIWAFCKEHNLSGGDRCDLMREIDKILNINHFE